MKNVRLRLKIGGSIHNRNASLIKKYNDSTVSDSQEFGVIYLSDKPIYCMFLLSGMQVLSEIRPIGCLAKRTVSPTNL